MKFAISAFILGISFCQYASGSPQRSKYNELEEPKPADSHEAEKVLSSEIMPGRYLTDQEIHNMIYLARTEAGGVFSDGKYSAEKHREKRFIFTQRSWQDRLQRRHERTRLRMERRRLRLQNQRIRQQQNLQRLNLQNSMTQKRFQEINSQNNKQQVVPIPLNIFIPQQQPQVKPYSIPITTTKSPVTTAKISTTTPSISKNPNEPNVETHNFQQVPLPFGKK